MRNILLVLSGPSGVGKGTLKEKLMREGDFEFSVSCTTRSPRETEKDGQDYYFIPRAEFLRRVAAGEFLEYDEHFGNLYGTLRSAVEERLKERSVLLDVDVVGALNVKKRYPEAVLVILMPPTLEALEARLIGRDSETESDRKNRLARASFELAQKDKFDYAVVNDDLARAAAELSDIVNYEKNRA